MERFIKKPHMVAGLRRGPLAKYLDLFADELSDDGYSVPTGSFQLLVVSDFSRWLETKCVQAEEVTRNHSTRYMQYRDEMRWGKRADAEAAINKLFELLRRLEVISVANPNPRTELDEIAEEYSNYLLEQCGFSVKTVSGYQRLALRFLSYLTDSGHFDPASLCAANILNFVREQGPTFRGSRGKNTMNALRSFLRFARYQEYVNVDLADLVPRIANWSLGSIPKSIPPEQVELVLSSCDRMTNYGKRDYAILLLLARLGLRGGEVLSLSLDNINWETGTLTVKGKSGPRVLPLPNDVGEALAEYLSDVRPRTKSRVVFFRLRPPIRAMKSQESICGIVRRAMERARIKSTKRGAHQFRHGLATELLRKGASIPEIGEILGHQRIDSTMIYAKVDLNSLRKLAKCWPGGAQ